jgi:hypothetical protein
MDRANGQLVGGLLNQLAATKSGFDRAFKPVVETEFNVRYKCGELGERIG